MDAPARRVSIAVGMITAPFFWDRRGQVRSTMMQYPPVLAGRMAFRFVIGNYMPSLQLDTAAVRSKVAALDQEITQHADIVRVDSIDGPNLDNACSCVEKQAAWVQFALRAWPEAGFIAKTEDDTYVQLQVLEGELMALREHRNVLYGYHTLSLMPIRPTPRPEAKPETACVSRAQSCRKSIAAKAAASAAAPPRPGTAPGLRRQRLSFNAMNSVTQSAGCFLGDMEDKLLVDAESGVLQVCMVYAYAWCMHMHGACICMVHARHVLQVYALHLHACPRPHTRSRLPQVWPTLLRSCEQDPTNMTLAPFPTGPLAVWGADLARTMFVDCAYLQTYLRDGRQANRQGGCDRTRSRRPGLVGRSFASLLCDTVIGHWVAMCTANATIAHMTRTKSHHYHHRAGGLGWAAPHALSVAVHNLKSYGRTKRSGPNSTHGGEWNHVHSLVAPTTASAFPSFLWRFENARSFDARLTTRAPLLVPLNLRVMEWHMMLCAMSQLPLRAAIATRAERMSEVARGVVRPVAKSERRGNASDAAFIGGNPISWAWSGCNPSRFRDRLCGEHARNGRPEPPKWLIGQGWPGRGAT